MQFTDKLTFIHFRSGLIEILQQSATFGAAWYFIWCKTVPGILIFSCSAGFHLSVSGDNYCCWEEKKSSSCPHLLKIKNKKVFKLCSHMKMDSWGGSGCFIRAVFQAYSINGVRGICTVLCHQIQFIWTRQGGKARFEALTYIIHVFFFFFLSS